LKTNILTTALAAGNWMMCINEDGVAQTTNPQQLIHGGLIRAGSITSDYGQIAELTVGSAEMKDLAVVSGKIGNLEVGTLKIANEATRLYETAYSSAEFAFSRAGEYVEGDTIVSLGSMVSVSSFATFENKSGDEPVTVTLSLRCADPSATLISESFVLGVGVILTKNLTRLHTPGAGSRSYGLWASHTGTANFVYASLRGGVLEESKGK